MISERQKVNIQGIIFRLKFGEKKYFHEFLKDEVNYIFELLETQQQKFFTLETDGTAADRSTQTFFRKIELPEIIKPYQK